MKEFNTASENIAKITDIFHLMGDTSRLRLLKAARIRYKESRGKQVFHTIDDHHIRQTIADMLEHIVEANHE